MKIVKNTNLSMKLELTMVTLERTFKSNVLIHILILDIVFQEKVEKLSPIFSVLPKFLPFYPKTPKRPNNQSANMAKFEAFL